MGKCDCSFSLFVMIVNHPYWRSCWSIPNNLRPLILFQRYCDVIMGAHSRHLRRVQSVIDGEMERERKKNQDKANAAKKKKKKKKKKPVNATASSGGESPFSTAPSAPVISEPTLITPTVEQQKEAKQVVRIQQQLVTARLNLTRGTFLVLAALTKTGYLSTTPAHLASHGLNDLETLYKQRFKAFHHLSSPELLSFPAYLERLECDRLDVSFHVLVFAKKVIRRHMESAL